jgi:hypothetical protein
LEVLDDRGTAELTHGNDECSCHCTADVLARKHLLERDSPGRISLLSLKFDLFADLNEFLVGEKGIMGFMEPQKN